MESDKETAVSAPPELTLELDDATLVNFIDAYVKKSESFYKTKKLDEKRKRNRKYYFGKQLEDLELKDYEKKVMDNVIKEGEDQLRPIVLNKMPDIVVRAGVSNDKESMKNAEAISKVVTAELTDRILRKILTRAFRHHPIYYTAIIKYRWDESKGKYGGIRWEVVHPDNVIVDCTATENDQEQMKIIIHYVEKSLSDWIMLFPKEEEALKEFARDKGKLTGEFNEKAKAVNLKIAEVWFDYSQKAENFDPKNPEFEHISGVCWKAGSNILDKRQNPNWDWEGEEKLFINGQPVPEQLIPQLAIMGNQVPGLERQKTYRNFFSKPRKPFIFFGFEQYGEMPYDEISRIEDNIPMQDNYDYRTRQIMKMIDDAQGKHVFSTLSGLKKSTIEEMDLNDPDEDVIIDGDLRQVHEFIRKEQPSNQMFADLDRTRERMMSKLSINPSLRGEIRTDVATTTQIAREQGFTAADELSDNTIVDVTIQMAEAQLHMMKLRYTPDHFRMILGRLGDQVQQEFTADLIDDGMEVTITASGTDKLKSERQAKEEAQLGLIDPLNYLKDTGRDNAETRAEMLMTFQISPELYMKKYVQGQDVPELAQMVGQANQQRQQQTTSGNPVQPVPGNPTEAPMTPAGSVRSTIGRAGQTLRNVFS
jgi:hypothetical protein